MPLLYLIFNGNLQISTPSFVSCYFRTLLHLMQFISADLCAPCISSLKLFTVLINFPGDAMGLNPVEIYPINLAKFGSYLRTGYNAVGILIHTSCTVTASQALTSQSQCSCNHRVKLKFHSEILLVNLYCNS